MEFQAILNYLAGTVNLEAQGAANALNGTQQIELTKVMNDLAGTTGLALNGAVKAYARLIGGNPDLDANAALNDALNSLIYPALNLFPAMTLFP